ncbi:MAG: hypothetical protein AAGC81_05650 [Pseudomonadota bacterium]
MRDLRAIIIGSAFALSGLEGRAFETYDACLEAIGKAPKQAVDQAAKWAEFDGGWAALHCQALALAAVGAPVQAATILVDVGTEAAELPRQVRAEMFVQAGELFLEAEEVTEAEESLLRATNLADDRSLPLSLSAAIKMHRGRPRAAIADYGEAIRLGGPRLGYLLGRSEARLRAGDAIGARDDAVWARELAPEDPEVLYQFGRASVVLGDRKAARQAWIDVIAMARGTSLEEAARLSLQRMEAGQ